MNPERASTAERRLEALGQAPVVGLLLRLSLPSFVALLCGALYNLIDAYWVARLGPAAVAGLTLVFPFQLLVTAAGSGLGAGLATLAARLLGQGRRAEADGLASQAAGLTLALGLPLALTAWLVLPAALPWAGAPEAQADAGSYAVGIAPGVPLLIFAMLASNLLRGAGDTVTPTAAMLGGALLNLALAPVLVLGWGGGPRLGTLGAGLATSLAQAASALWLALALARGASAYRPASWFGRLQGPTVAEAVRLGLPAAMGSVLLTLVVAFHNQLLAPFGAAVLGTWGILFRLAAVLIMPCWGVCQGLLPIAAHAHGARDRARALAAVRASVIGTALLGGLAAALAHAYARQVIGAFHAGPELEAEAVPALRVAALGWPLVGPQLVWLTALQSADRPGAAGAVLLGKTFLVQAPVVWLLCRAQGPAGVWAAQPLVELLGLVLAFALARPALRALGSGGQPHGSPRT